MEDVEDRQKRAVERAKKKHEKDDDESDDDEKETKKKSSQGSDDEAQEEEKPKEMPKSIAQVSKEMAVRKTIQAIKDRQNKQTLAEAENQPVQPKLAETKKKQIENDFVPEPNQDAQTFSRDLKNLE